MEEKRIRRRRVLYFLGLVAHGGAPDPGILELRDELFVQFVAEVFHARRLVVKDDGRAVVGDLTLRLSRRKVMR